MKSIMFGDSPILVPNDIAMWDIFYISYNDRDITIYGDITTALVLGNMEKFLILNGDHREQYISCGGCLTKCLLYFSDNMERVNKYSDKVGTKGYIA